MAGEDQEDDEELDAASDGQAQDEAQVSCPYCGEMVEIALDPGGSAVQDYVEDCQVCCRPWRVHVRWGRDGTAEVSLTADDESDSEE